MKSALPWLLVVVALVGGYFFFAANKEKAGELTRLNQELQELQTLRAENAELKKTQVPADELDRLRKGNEDLLRLRNEVRQLRDAQKQLTQQVQTAQSEIQRAQAQTQAAQAQAQAQMRAREQELLQHAQAAQAQAQALGTNAALTPEQQAYAARYVGLNPQSVAQVNACINNLRQIDSAKQQWALENGKKDQTIPTVQDVAAYIRGGALPKCPGGGAYTLNAVGASPTCSIPLHALAP